MKPGLYPCVLLHGCGEDFLPQRMSDGAVGYDVRAAVIQHDSEMTEVAPGFSIRKPIHHLKEDGPITILPGERKLFGVGVAVAIPWKVAGLLTPRSGLARMERDLANGPGLADPDFRGEIGVLLRNNSDQPFEVKYGMRIAQLVFTPVEIPAFFMVPDLVHLPATRRGGGGFGSTGLMGTGIGTEEYWLLVNQIDTFCMNVALAAAERSDCVRGCECDDNGRAKKDASGKFTGQRKRFGCVFAEGDNIVASGYNTQTPGQPRCAEVGCLRDKRQIPSGERTEICRGIHAEEMAILNAARSNRGVVGTTLYITAPPTVESARKIAFLGVEAVVVPGDTGHNEEGLEIIRLAGIPVRHLKYP